MSLYYFIKQRITAELLRLKEITTPDAIANYGHIYPKADNLLYFQDGAGVEHALTLVDKNYGEAYIYNNAVNTVIETADIPIALRQILEGSCNNFTFDAGSTGTITSYQSGIGGAGFTRVNSVGHGLSNGDVITIRGASVAGYNGVHTVSSVNVDYFDIDENFSVDGGASDFDQGASLTANGGTDGMYACAWIISTAPALACQLSWKIYVNATPQNKSVSERIYENNSMKGAAANSIVNIVTGDKIWLSVQSDSTADILNVHGNFNLHQL